MTAVASRRSSISAGRRSPCRAAAAFRALFVASHTEAVQMTPAHLSLFGMALSIDGFAVTSSRTGRP